MKQSQAKAKVNLRTKILPNTVRWSIRWRAIFGLTLIFILTFSSIFLWFSYTATKIAQQQLDEYLISVVRLAAEGIDGDTHQELYADPDYDSSLAWPTGMADERYWEISQWLYTVHQSNPHAYLYTYVSPEPGVIEYVVSHGATLEPVEGASYGHRYTPSYPSIILEGLNKEILSLNIIHDEWGTWLSGFAPIYNSENAIVAAVGVDYNAIEITKIQDAFKRTAISAFAISYSILILVAIFFANSMAKPIISLSKATKMMGKGKLSLVKQDSNFFQDEISDLTRAFNTMNEMMSEREKKLLRQTEELRIFHQAAIDGRENEKTALAMNIHDELLNQLAVFSMNETETGSKYQVEIDAFANRIRQIITSLRPVMLNYGLWLALEEYVDELSNRVGITSKVILEIPASDVRFDPKIEEHTYRIVQQACENALRHAHCDTIRIFGVTEPDIIQISVEDNGIGIKMTNLDFHSIIKNKSFGLANMYERAALIGAELTITSNPGQGTRISIIKLIQ